MRKTPDGSREVIEMLVPVTGSRSRTVRISGLGLPPKIGVGAFDLPDETWLNLLNRDVRGGHLRYDQVETVRGGMMPLADKPLQGADQTYAARGGATFGMGTRKAPAEGSGQVVTAADGAAKPTMSWLVTDARRKYLLVAPDGLDSFQLTELIARAMHGEFTIEMVSSGQMTAAEEIAAPGWKVLMEPPAPCHEPMPMH